MDQRPNILIISGFDPSGGAGMLADTKTVEACGGKTLGILSANTIQNNQSFFELHWVADTTVLATMEALKDSDVHAIKIGICPNFSSLKIWIDAAKALWPEAPIVWDPVLKSTSGGTFFDTSNGKIELEHIGLITPNKEEYNTLSQLLPKSDYLIKSFLTSPTGCVDRWIPKVGNAQDWANQKAPGLEKRGTGCILSSAIATCLGAGHSMEKSIDLGQAYLQNYYRSNEEKIGKFFAHEN